jgi:hypothetical protein
MQKELSVCPSHFGLKMSSSVLPTVNFKSLRAIVFKICTDNAEC